MRSDKLALADIVGEGMRAGHYVQVVEAGLFPHSTQGAFARRLSDNAGRLGSDQMIVRIGGTQLEGFDEAGETPAPYILASNLQWGGASREQLEFMRHVYEKQVRRAARERPFIGNIPETQLSIIEGEHRARMQAAAACRALLTAARITLDEQIREGVGQAQQVEDIHVLSAYRSASIQFSNWQRNFPRYYQETREDRATIEGGDHGDAAAEYLARYIGRPLAAPGFSSHNAGRAVDFGTGESGRTLDTSTNTSNIRQWEQSWLFR